MRRLVFSMFALLALAVAAMPAPAAAAKKKKAKTPAIKLVSPMRVAVGRTLTIRGKNFSSSKRKNTIVFRGPGKRSAFAKPKRASRTKLVVKVPGSVEKLLTTKNARRMPTRFSLRVVTKRYGKLTPRRRSPVIVSSTEGGSLDCGSGTDFDGDLLSNSREASLKTDACARDTDRDGVEDYFEVESALDLNLRAVPYPGKRPFPNALDPSDAGNDYDGDGLSMTDEFRAWAKASASPAASLLQNYSTDPKAPVFAGPYGDRPRFGAHGPTLNYSDGDQSTLGVVPGDPEFKSYLDFDNNSLLTDDERDADGDGLGNQPELYGLMRFGYYPGPTPEEPLKDYKPNPALPRAPFEPSYLDWDSDGDGVWDGNDDQDDDDVSNFDEIEPAWQFFDGGGPYPIGNARDSSAVIRTPYNACKPYRSPTCNRYVPASGDGGS